MDDVKILTCYSCAKEYEFKSQDEMEEFMNKNNWHKLIDKTICFICWEDFKSDMESWVN